MPRHRCDRICRRPPRPRTPRTRIPDKGPCPHSCEGARCRMGGTGRDRRGRCRRPGLHRGGDARSRRRVLPAALAAGGPQSRAGRARHRRELREGSTRAGRLAHRLPRRTRAEHPAREDVAAHAVARRGRSDPAGLGRSDHRVPRCSHHRLRLSVLRDDALPDRAAPRDDHPAVGSHEDPADRRARRASLPRPRRRAAPRTQSVIRYRGSGGHDLPGDDAPVCQGGRAAATDHPAHQPALAPAVEPLGQPRHPRAEGDRPAARPVAQPPGDVHGERHQGVDSRSAGGARQLRRGGSSRPHPDPGCRGGHTLVWCLHRRPSVRPPPERPRLGRGHPVRGHSRAPHDRLAV